MRGFSQRKTSRIFQKKPLVKNSAKVLLHLLPLSMNPIIIVQTSFSNILKSASHAALPSIAQADVKYG